MLPRLHCLTHRNVQGLRRAGNGTRTRDFNLGKVALYQLSYSREVPRGPTTPLQSSQRAAALRITQAPKAPINARPRTAATPAPAVTTNTKPYQCSAEPHYQPKRQAITFAPRRQQDTAIPVTTALSRNVQSAHDHRSTSIPQSDKNPGSPTNASTRARPPDPHHLRESIGSRLADRQTSAGACKHADNNLAHRRPRARRLPEAVQFYPLKRSAPNSESM